MKRLFGFLFFIILTSSGCEETIILDTEQVETRLVIDAHITDDFRTQRVELSTTVDFYFDQRPPGINNAEVLVRDLTTSEVYEFSLAQESSFDGVYFSNEPFAGIAGHLYELEVVYEGELYTGREILNPVSEIDSLTYRINFDEQADPDSDGFFYEVLLYAEEPQETVDYYFFKFYRNDTLIYDGETDIYFTDDQFLGATISDLPAPVFYSQGDIATVEIYGITRQAYIYLNDLFNVLNTDSGLFSPPPANPRNNLTNGALGYFMVSGVNRATIVID